MAASPESFHPRKDEQKAESFTSKFESEYADACSEVDSAILKHFPKEYGEFPKPSIERAMSAAGVPELRHMLVFRNFPANPLARFASSREVEAIKTGAIVRYVDDFIDIALWPHIPEYEPTELRTKFTAFLEEALVAAQVLVPSLPDKIIELPQLEMSLELDPSQENFDKKIIPFVECKSFDLRHMYLLAHDHPTLHGYQEGQFKALSIHDLGRDFSETNYTQDKDFNLRNFLYKHKVDPHVLADYVLQVVEELRLDLASNTYSKQEAEELSRWREGCVVFYTELLSAWTGKKVVFRALNA